MTEIVIETIEEKKNIDGIDTYNWRDYKRALFGKGIKPTKLRVSSDDSGELLREAHHQQYGRPWVVGRYMFQHILSRGFRPKHTLLDVGCGAGRFGIHAINYLETGNYYGLDVHRWSLEAFAGYELFLHGLLNKAPRLLWTGTFDTDHFDIQFDWVLDFSTTLHIPENMLHMAFQKMAASVKKGGAFICSPEPRLSIKELDELGLDLVCVMDQPCPLLEGSGVDSALKWYEFLKRAI